MFGFRAFSPVGLFAISRVGLLAPTASSNWTGVHSLYIPQTTKRADTACRYKSIVFDHAC